MVFRIEEGNFGIFEVARTISRSAGTAFKDRKSLVKTVKSWVPAPRFPPDFPFPISRPRSQIPKHVQIYYLDRYYFSRKRYLELRDFFDSIIMFYVNLCTLHNLQVLEYYNPLLRKSKFYFTKVAMPIIYSL
jgi:hypothetical protein